MRTQTSGDNTVNDLRYEIKFEIVFFTKFFLEQKYISLSETYFLKILKNSIASEYFFFFFFAKPDTKKHKLQRASNAKSSNAALVKLTD